MEEMNRLDLLQGSGCGSERQRGRNNKNNGRFEKMNINGIGTTGYPAWQSAKKAQQNMAGKSFVA